MSTSDPTAPAEQQGPQAPEPLTDPGEPTALQRLAEVGRYIDHSLLPTANEIPQVIAALVYGENLAPFVQELRQAGHSDAEISAAASHVISPPVPGATATVIQGVDPAQHQALQDQVAELRALVEQLHGQAQLPAPTPAEAPAPTSGAGPSGLANTGQLTAEQQELLELRQQVQALRIQEAAGQHPTAESEPVADEAPAPAEPVAPADPPPPPPEVQG